MMDLMRFELVIDEETSNMRIEEILIKKLSMSKRQIRKLKNLRLILLNNEPVYVKSYPSIGDRLEVNFPEEHVENMEPEDITINILYEDKDLLIVDKEAGMNVHPSSKREGGALANGVAYYLSEKNENPMVRPVNRLDKDTSGIVIFAKNQYAHFYLQQNGFEKEYIAIVHGIVKEASCVDIPIEREEGSIIKRKAGESGKRAVTYYEPMEYIDGSTVLLVKPVTGRTHQIRVHLCYIGHPIYGDTLYGKPDIMKRQALHAWKVQLMQPVTKKLVRCEAPLPEDMKTLIKTLSGQHYS
ncbi:MAG: RluA family pseudouridine synthase [Thermoanaerobacteraceae bacterium]|nr:RluA family pseudouridine synthase [Thermoanaerobacteraceae bacterium]